MTERAMQPESRLPIQQEQPRTLWRRMWPIALAVVVAAATAFRLTDGREVAPVVAASGLVYLAAAAVGRRPVAWVAFGIAFALIALDKFVGVDATPWILALAAAMLVVGLAAGRTGPWWAFPLQSIAMIVLSGVAVLAVALSPMAGGLLVAAALIGHAAWDVHHHRTGRVVGRSLAEFCAVLDILVAGIVVFVTFR